MRNSVGIPFLSLLEGLVLGVALGRSFAPFIPASVVPEECCGKRISFENPRQSITIVELKELLQSGLPIRLIDVREFDKHAVVRIPGSRSVPMGVFIDPVNDFSESAVVVNGAAQADSELAARELRELGLVNVRYLDGGLTSWRKASFPIEP